MEKYEDFPSDFASDLAEKLHRSVKMYCKYKAGRGYSITLLVVEVHCSCRPLQEQFEQEARELLAAQAEGEAGAMRKKHSSLQEQLQGLWYRAKLFDKGAQQFEGMCDSFRQVLAT